MESNLSFISTASFSKESTVKMSIRFSGLYSNYLSIIDAMALSAKLLPRMVEFTVSGFPEMAESCISLCLYSSYGSLLVNSVYMTFLKLYTSIYSFRSASLYSSGDLNLNSFGKRGNK